MAGWGPKNPSLVVHGLDEELSQISAALLLCCWANSRDRTKESHCPYSIFWAEESLCKTPKPKPELLGCFSKGMGVRILSSHVWVPIFLSTRTKFSFWQHINIVPKQKHAPKVPSLDMICVQNLGLIFYLFILKFGPNIVYDLCTSWGLDLLSRFTWRTIRFVLHI